MMLYKKLNLGVTMSVFSEIQQRLFFSFGYSLKFEKIGKNLKKLNNFILCLKTRNAEHLHKFYLRFIL